MISGLPGMPTTTDTRPPATAGPRLRNLKLALISALEPDAAAMAGAAAANAAHSNAKVETQIGNLRNSSGSLMNVLRWAKTPLPCGCDGPRELDTVIRGLISVFQLCMAKSGRP